MCFGLHSVFGICWPRFLATQCSPSYYRVWRFATFIWNWRQSVSPVYTGTYSTSTYFGVHVFTLSLMPLRQCPSVEFLFPTRNSTYVLHSTSYSQPRGAFVDLQLLTYPQALLTRLFHPPSPLHVCTYTAPLSTVFRTYRIGTVTC